MIRARHHCTVVELEAEHDTDETTGELVVTLRPVRWWNVRRWRRRGVG